MVPKFADVGTDSNMGEDEDNKCKYCGKGRKTGEWGGTEQT